MKLFSDKRGIELSINFIVMLILAIAVFAGGLLFASKFFGHAEKVRGSLDAQTEKQIEKLLDSGSPVVIPINTKEIFRNKYDTFGIGVLAQYSGKFTLKLEFKNEAFDSDKQRIQNSGAESWYEVAVKELELEKNEKGQFLVLIRVPKSAEKGTYIFHATVGFEPTSASPSDAKKTDEYDNPLQFIVKVP